MRSEREDVMRETAQNSVTCAPSPAMASARLWRSFLVERYDLKIIFNDRLSMLDCITW
jgi:hypothetical protein